MKRNALNTMTLFIFLDLVSEDTGVAVAYPLAFSRIARRITLRQSSRCQQSLSGKCVC